MTQFVNLTPHVINAIRKDGSTESFDPSGSVARVGSVATPVDFHPDFDVTFSDFGDVVGLPDPQPNTVFIVSGMVLDAPSLAGRTDLVAPGNLVRGEDGQPKGCQGFRTRKPL